MIQDSTHAATAKPQARLVGGDQLAGIRLGPTPEAGTPDGGARLEGCLLAVVAEGQKALASGIALQAEEEQLVLELMGVRVAGWSWSNVIGICADGIAADPDGKWTQLLEVSTADHTFRFLAPAFKIGIWVSALPAAAKARWSELADARDGYDIVTELEASAAGEAPAADDASSSDGASVADGALAGISGISHLGGDEQMVDEPNWPPRQSGDPNARSGPDAGAAPGPTEDLQTTRSTSGDAKDPSAPRAARHARRRLFGRSARSDNRHTASHVRPGRRPVRTTEVLRNLLTWSGPSSRPAHAMSGKSMGRHIRIRTWSRQRRIATIALGLALAGTTAASTAAAFQPTPVKALHSAGHVVGPVAPDWPQTQGLQVAFAPPARKTFKLARAKAKPLPAPPSLASEPSLSSHEIFAFAPYWTLAQESGFNVNDLSTVSYFGLDVNADGSIQQSGDGWTGYQSQDLADLINRAHAAGSRVVLTVECFDQTTLDKLTSDPSAASTLGKQLVGLIRTKNMDGVNVDFEGAGSTDQTGLDKLMARVSSIVRGANGHWQITMDTYASSAGDSQGFYDISGLAPSVDAFFVMAYQMGGPTGSANGQFSGSNFSAEESMQEYTQVVPSSKVILGLPFYGYDWPTNGSGASAAATGPASPVPDSQISSSPAYWNQSTGTAWTAYKIGKQWHQTWFDDPQALAQKAQVANSFDARGVGIWTLGMEGNDPAMLAALVGNAPVAKAYALPPSGPAPNVSRSSTTSTTRGKATTTTSLPATTTTDPRSSTTTAPQSTTTTQPTTSTTLPPTTTTTEPQTTTTTSAPTTTTSTTG